MGTNFSVFLDGEKGFKCVWYPGLSIQTHGDSVTGLLHSFDCYLSLKRNLVHESRWCSFFRIGNYGRCTLRKHPRAPSFSLYRKCAKAVILI